MARAFDLEIPDLLRRLNNRIAREEPRARTMVLVALANARSDLKINKTNNDRHGTDLPITYDGFGRRVALLFDKYPPATQRDLEIPTEAEIKFRRLYHFYHAAILGAVSERAHEANAHLDQLASIWCSYIESAKYLPALLSNTPLWSKDETEWFAGCTDEENHIRNVVYTVVPQFLWEHGEMLSMAKECFDIGSSLLRA